MRQLDVFSYQDYRDILQSELARRMKQNPRYSQGAFARDLDLTPSRLSEILHGKQGVSSQVATHIATCLRFTEEQRSYFLDLVESQHGRSRLQRDAARVRLVTQRKAPFAERRGEDFFQAISDWYHVAMLELLRLPQQEPTSAGIAAALRLDVQGVEEALGRLERLGCVRETSPGHWELVDSYQRFVGSMHSESFQKFSRQILWKAIEAVEETQAQGMHSYMIALPQEQVPHLIGKIKETCNQLAETLDGEQGRKDVVYCLAVQFFPLSKAEPTVERGSELH